MTYFNPNRSFKVLYININSTKPNLFLVHTVKFQAIEVFIFIIFYLVLNLNKSF